MSTKIELRVRLNDLPIPPAARRRLRALAGRRINAADELVLTAASSRSQQANRRQAVERLRRLVERALATPAARIPTTPTRSAQRRRRESKSRRSEAKRLRSKPPLED